MQQVDGAAFEIPPSERIRPLRQQPVPRSRGAANSREISHFLNFSRRQTCARGVEKFKKISYVDEVKSSFQQDLSRVDFLFLFLGLKIGPVNWKSTKHTSPDFSACVRSCNKFVRTSMTKFWNFMQWDDFENEILFQKSYVLKLGTSNFWFWLK